MLRFVPYRTIFGLLLSLTNVFGVNSYGLTSDGSIRGGGAGPGVDFLAFPPINIGEIYKKIFDLRKVISQSEILFDLKQLHQLSVGL